MGLLTVPCFAVTNSITLRNNAAAAVSNYPLQFARPFVRGEIAAFPQLGVCADATCTTVSSWLTTQADVKARWDDGSAKHVILSVVVPSIPNGSTSYTFRNQASCNCGTGESKSQMLAAGYDFDARMEVAQKSTTKTASARTMVSDWAQTRLLSDLPAAATSITVENGAGFPPAPFAVTIGSEEMNVISKGSGTNWTVARGFNGTTATTHTANEQLADQRLRYWVAGSIATTVQIGDFSVNRLYDFGWQPAHVMTLTAAMNTSGTTVSVDDASGVQAPFHARLFRPLSATFLSNGGNSEDVYVCAVNTSTTPHQLTIGNVGCTTSPSIAGRHVRGSSAVSFAVGDKIHPDPYWQEPSSDIYKSIKPIFYATFWPSINKVSVRFVLEIADTERLQDQIYDLVLKSGLAAPTAFYSGHQVQRYATRLTKTTWVGAPPVTIDIIHNVAYLSSTKLTWNWDPKRSPSTTAMNSAYTAYAAGAHSVCGDGGTIQRAMGSGGARPEIAPENQWFVQWLYTGYDPIRTVAFEYADLSSCGWATHFREGNPDKKYDRDRTVSGFGKPISTSDRRSTAFNGYNYSGTAASDRVSPIGPFTSGGWLFDIEHLYNLHLPLYLVTGDHFYLEEGLFSQSTACHYLNGAAIPPTIYGRGPTGAECWVSGSLRAQAWNLRFRSELAAYLPDAMSSEKALSQNYVADSLAPLEATLGLGNSYPSNPVWNTMYNYGNTSTVKMAGYRVNGAPHPMGLLRADQGAAFAQPNYGIDSSFVGGADSLFEMGYLTLNLGFTRDLGFYPQSLNKLLGFVSQFYNGAATDPNYNKFLLAAGRVPTVYKSSGLAINSWADMKRGYFADYGVAKTACGNCGNPIWQGVGSFPLNGALGGYDIMSMSAIAQVADRAKGAEAWAFAESQLERYTTLNDLPQWNLLPRVTVGGGLTMVLSPTALNFSCPAGGVSPPPQIIAFSSSGGAIDNFSVTTTPNWLTISPAHGAAPQNLTATVSCTGLAEGPYSSVISIESSTSGVTNSPHQVPINLSVSVPPKTRLTGLQISGSMAVR